jgi:ATP-dependent protease ClpP protease subunit
MKPDKRDIVMATDIYRPGMKRAWFNLAFDEEKKSADIYLYNDIGFYGVTARDFLEELNSVNANDLNIYINSMGGEVADGLAIYNALKRHNGNKTVHVDGMAASIASVIAMAGDKIVMPETALMFLHKPWTMTAGNADDLQRTAEQLEKTESAIVAAYAQKTGLDAATIESMLRDETTLNAKEAVSLGFADAIKAEETEITEFAFAGAMMNRVLCSMTSKPGVKNTMDNETAETPEVEPVVTEVEPVVEPIPEVTADEPTPADPVAEARAEFIKFVDRFGPDRATGYIKASLSFDDAERAYLVEVEAENKLLKERLAVADSIKAAPIKANDDTGAKSWKDRLAQCGGDYVKARTMYPSEYSDFMKNNNKGK